jgi:hypothetical protein
VSRSSGVSLPGHDTGGQGDALERAGTHPAARVRATIRSVSAGKCRARKNSTAPRRVVGRSRYGLRLRAARSTVSTTPSSGSYRLMPSSDSPAAAVESWIGLRTADGYTQVTPTWVPISRRSASAYATKALFEAP